MSRPFRVLLIAPVVALLAACSGSSKKSSTTSTTLPAPTTLAAGPTTSVAAGADQRNTPFCQTVSKLVAITQPSKDPGTADQLLNDGVQQAPAEIKSAFQVVAGLLHAAAHPAETTTSIDATYGSQIQQALTTVGDYAYAHCGIQLQTGQ